MGQEWIGSTCKGDLEKYTWDEAQRAAKEFGSGWRVPTIEELMSIRRCSAGWQLKKIGYKAKPTGGGKVAIWGDIDMITLPSGTSVPTKCAYGSSRPVLNTDIFPNTLSDGDLHWLYWSSSPFDGDNRSAWLVLFHSGAYSYYAKNDHLYVRLVRSNQ